MGELETADTIYTLLMACEIGTGELLAERTRAFPQVTQLPKDRAAWVPAEGMGAMGVPTMADWDAIHRHYDAHRDELIHAHAQRELANAERERQLREHPPVRKATVIRYWKKGAPATPRQNAEALK